MIASSASTDTTEPGLQTFRYFLLNKGTSKIA